MLFEMKSTGSTDFLEPVMIDVGAERWVNPEIKELLDWETNGANEGKWSYNGLTRISIENSKKKIAYLVVYSRDLEDGKISFEELEMMLFVSLFEDVWSPGGEQFCFSKFGKRLSKSFQKSIRITFVSPDIGIEDSDGVYEWNT